MESDVIIRQDAKQTKISAFQVSTSLHSTTGTELEFKISLGREAMRELQNQGNGRYSKVNNT